VIYGQVELRSTCFQLKLRRSIFDLGPA
jgi:hypothetical protein